MKSKDVILFSTADWDTPYWTNKQHTAVHLAKMGYRVLYVETVGIRPPKLSSGRDLRRISKRIWRSLRGSKLARRNVWVLSPLTLPFFHSSKLVSIVNKILLRLQLKASILILRFRSPLVWTYHPYMLDVVKNSDVCSIVYHCVDDLAAIPGVDVQAFRKAEQCLLERAEVVFVTSKKLEVNCKKYSSEVYFMPNVVDFDHFSSARLVRRIPEDLSRIPEPRIGYVGVLSDFKVDFDLIVEVALARPDFQWVFIGEEREGQESEVVNRLRKLENVHFLGYKPYQELPQYLAGLNVATLPSLINEYTDSMFPMKFYEYVAAGLPVVSTPLSFTATLTAGIELARSVDEFSEKLNQQINKGLLDVEQSLDIVASNTWQTRLKNMLEVVG